MHCPHLTFPASFVEAQCDAVVVPFEPGETERLDFCTSGRHRRCPLYRQANRNLTRAIRREVVRAIG